MPVIEVTDPDDPRLVDYFHLTDVALRSRREPERGLFMAESSEVIRRAAEAGHRARSLLMAERWRESLADVIGEFEQQAGEPIPVYVADESILQRITGFHLHRGALAAMQRPRLPSVDAIVRSAHRVVVLEDIVDHTNVGAIFRSVAALGADAVLVSPRCADPLYRRSVRVSMGAVFQVPWTRMAAWPQGLDELRDAGFTVAALGLTEPSITLDQLAQDAPERLALLLGAEGDGLSARAVASADVVARIPMMRGIDSLNVAAASAVALWALRRP